MECVDRVENPILREYICNFVPNKLNQNKIFVKVFGKHFAKKRIKSEILTVYTDELPEKSGCDGYHDGIKKEITICKRGNGRFFTKN